MKTRTERALDRISSEHAVPVLRQPDCMTKGSKGMNKGALVIDLAKRRGGIGRGVKAVAEAAMSVEEWNKAFPRHPRGSNGRYTDSLSAALRTPGGTPENRAARESSVYDVLQTMVEQHGGSRSALGKALLEAIGRTPEPRQKPLKSSKILSPGAQFAKDMEAWRGGGQLMRAQATDAEWTGGLADEHGAKRPRLPAEAVRPGRFDDEILEVVRDILREKMPTSQQRKHLESLLGDMKVGELRMVAADGHDMEAIRGAKTKADLVERLTAGVRWRQTANAIEYGAAKDLDGPGLTAKQKINNFEKMHGSDRSKWTPTQRKQVEYLERTEMAEERASRAYGREVSEVVGQGAPLMGQKKPGGGVVTAADVADWHNAQQAKGKSTAGTSAGAKKLTDKQLLENRQRAEAIGSVDPKTGKSVWEMTEAERDEYAVRRNAETGASGASKLEPARAGRANVVPGGQRRNIAKEQEQFKEIALREAQLRGEQMTFAGAARPDLFEEMQLLSEKYDKLIAAGAIDPARIVPDAAEKARRDQRYAEILERRKALDFKYFEVPENQRASVAAEQDALNLERLGVPYEARNANSRKAEARAAADMAMRAMIAKPRPEHREELRTILSAMTLKEMKDFQEAHGGTWAKAPTKAEQIDRAVENLIGFRLNSQSIRHGWQDAKELMGR